MWPLQRHHRAALSAGAPLGGALHSAQRRATVDDNHQQQQLQMRPHGAYPPAPIPNYYHHQQQQYPNRPPPHHRPSSAFASSPSYDAFAQRRRDQLETSARTGRGGNGPSSSSSSSLHGSTAEQIFGRAFPTAQTPRSNSTGAGSNLTGSAYSMFPGAMRATGSAADSVSEQRRLNAVAHGSGLGGVTGAAARNQPNRMAWAGMRRSVKHVAAAVFPGLPPSVVDRLSIPWASAGNGNNIISGSSGYDGLGGSQPNSHPQQQQQQHMQPPAQPPLSPAAQEDLVAYHETYDQWARRNQQLLAERSEALALRQDAHMIVLRNRRAVAQAVHEVVNWTWWFMAPVMVLLLLSVATDARAYARQVQEFDFVDYGAVLRERSKKLAAAQDTGGTAAKGKKGPGSGGGGAGGGASGGGGGGGGGGGTPTRTEVKIE